ncbi:AAA ATPase-like protein [Naumannella halotolerans]|uniref:AAA ATPase-like protein n=2 Tax=Naumannella halotolerans TaxID=993414 RepID=A0A4R7J194_9ACTN|nr:AAA ATPase-like protein [Naumannella halotolerans]
MVGRDAELGAVLASIGVDPHRGADRLTDLLIAGDAGVGKSRLLAAVREEAERRGWSMVSGHCLDFGDADLAYLPFSEVVGQLVESWPTAMQQVLQAHPALAKLQPGRRTRSAGTGSDDDQAVDRPDLYRAMAAALAAVAKQNPLILVIDDCHWADRSTRELLTFLLSRGDPAGFAVIVSYRADDLHRRHPLRRHLAEWGRLGGVDRLQLGR